MVEVYQYLREMETLKKLEWVQNINATALGVAVGQGDKKAHQQLKKINADLEVKEKKAEGTIRVPIPLWKMNQANARE